MCWLLGLNPPLELIEMKDALLYSFKIKFMGLNLIKPWGETAKKLNFHTNPKNQAYSRVSGESSSSNDILVFESKQPGI